jgi:hypothetical protein
MLQCRMFFSIAECCIVLRPISANCQPGDMLALTDVPLGGFPPLAQTESRCRLGMQLAPRLLQPFVINQWNGKRRFLIRVLGLHGVWSETWSASSRVHRISVVNWTQ